MNINTKKTMNYKKHEWDEKGLVTEKLDELRRWAAYNLRYEDKSLFHTTGGYGNMWNKLPFLQLLQTIHYLGHQLKAYHFGPLDEDD